MTRTLPKHVTDPDPFIYASKEASYLVLDFETTNLDKGDPVNPENSVVLYSYFEFRPDFDAWSGGTLDYSIKSVNHLLGLVEQATFLVAHNAKFECGWLKRLGADLTKIVVFDTMLAEYVLLGQHTKPGDSGIDLDSCLARRGLGSKGKLVSTLVRAGVCPSHIPFKWLREYCEQDVRLTHALFRLQLQELVKAGLLPVFYTKCLQVPCLADIEFNGMCLDPERVREKYVNANIELGQITPELNEVTGGINPNSPKQVASLLFDTLGFDEPTDARGNPLRTASGQRSASADVIAKLTPRTHAQRRFIELKTKQSKLQSSISKYLEKFHAACGEAKGILHASINQAVTRTGRYSSNGKRYKCQFQNFDRTFKPLFRARTPGWYIGEADEAQLDFRVAVFLGNDAQGRQDISDRVDVHSVTRDIITQAGQKIDRQVAKGHTFKPLYGGTSGTKAEQTYYKAFKTKYAGITKWQEALVSEVVTKKKVVLPTGLILYFPEVKYSRNGYVEGNQQVRNYPVQYLATSEIVPIALVYAWHILKMCGRKTFIINTIHDSIISEVHPLERKEWADTMKLALEVWPIRYMEQVYGIQFDVPLEVELKLGVYWGEKEDE